MQRLQTHRQIAPHKPRPGQRAIAAHLRPKRNPTPHQKTARLLGKPSNLHHPPQTLLESPQTSTTHHKPSWKAPKTPPSPISAPKNIKRPNKPPPQPVRPQKHQKAQQATSAAHPALKKRNNFDEMPNSYRRSQEPNPSQTLSGSAATAPKESQAKRRRPNQKPAQAGEPKGQPSAARQPNRALSGAQGATYLTSLSSESALEEVT